MRQLLIVSLLLATSFVGDAQGNSNSYEQGLVEAGKLAKAYCAAPAFKQAACGWASNAEQDATVGNQCPYCGTLYKYPPKQLPGTLSSHPSYNQYVTNVVSLACKGRVVVRSVFKITKQPPVTMADLDGTDCTSSSLVYVDDRLAGEGGQATSVIRCELQLPSGPGTEAERAVKAKEINCYQCGRCSQGRGCPSKTGKWYSDSFTTKLPGCDFDAKVGYQAYRVGININPSTDVLLAKFEVCNNSGCFDPAYEDAKLKSAKFCYSGKCS